MLIIWIIENNSLFTHIRTRIHAYTHTHIYACFLLAKIHFNSVNKKINRGRVKFF